MEYLVKRIFITLLLNITLCLNLLSQRIVTDRPDQTESSTTIPYKSLQIETGILTGMTDHNNISEREWLIPTTLFRYGVTRIIELRITEQLERLKTGQPVNSYFGLSDLELGAKIQILKREGINTEIAFISHIIFPTGSGGLSGNSTGIITKIAISHSLSDFLDVSYNLGYTFPGHRHGDLTYSGTTGFRISGKSWSLCRDLRGSK